MEILLMIVFLVFFVLANLRSFTEVPTMGEAVVWVMQLVICFTGIMLIYYKK